MRRCQKLRILQLVPAPDQGPDQGLTPDLTLEATPAQDPENVAIGKFSDFFVFLTLTCIINCFCGVCGDLKGSFVQWLESSYTEYRSTRDHRSA